jgi:DNA-binding beta-propeller fold protein YncE
MKFLLNVGLISGLYGCGMRFTRARLRLLLIATGGVFAFAGAALVVPGVTLLPTQWKIQNAQAAVATVGNMPSGIVLSRDGSRIMSIDAGYGPKALRVLDTSNWNLVRTVPLRGAFGAPLRDAGDDGVWVDVPGPFQEQVAHINTETGAFHRHVSLPIPFYPVAIARAPSGMLAVAGDVGNRVAFIEPKDERIVGMVDVGEHPAAVCFSADGRTLYVADRAEMYLDVIDVRAQKLRGRIRVGLHPIGIATDGRRLFVADSDDDDVAVIDMAQGRTVQRVRVPFARDGITGALPNSILASGDRLYVTCGGANAIAVFHIGAERVTALGAIPAGWYPTGVAVDAARGLIYIENGKGEGSHTNPGYNYLDARHPAGYIALQLVGSIRRQPIPSDDDLETGLATVRDLAEHEPIPPSPIIRPNGPIKHVIYVIKENRSYDQVLGDEPTADGDPSLVLFGRAVTPNQHAIAERFGIFDRFFVDGHVSPDGHNWSTAAIANDYTEKMWPQVFSGRRPYFDIKDGARAARPHSGYLWDDAVRHGVSLRNYGEYAAEGSSAPTPVAVNDDILRPRTDRLFATVDFDIPDMDRFAEWKREFDLFEQKHTLPQLEIVYFARDHTEATKPGSVTPQGMVADNDQAVGNLVDAVTHSADWKSTAIFVLEDDAQSGPDHVDEQRSTFYLASPYAAGGVSHAHYTTASVLRTIEILLGLPPMTPYDAGAAPLSGAFRNTLDLRSFTALPLQVRVDERNSPLAYRAGDSAQMNFSIADNVPDGKMNDILWHAVKGLNATPPPYGAFDRNRPNEPRSGQGIEPTL